MILAVNLQDSSSRILHNNHIYILNVVMACILACQLLRSLLWLLYVLVRSWQLKRVWKRRRARSVTIFLVEIIAQMASALLHRKFLEYCLLKCIFLHICIGSRPLYPCCHVNTNCPDIFTGLQSACSLMCRY